MSAFFMSEIYDNFLFLRYFFVIYSILRMFSVLDRIFLFLLSLKFVNLVRIILSMMFNRAQ
jgi:hypothetical protein